MRYYNIIELKLQPFSNWSQEIINKKINKIMTIIKEFRKY